VYLPDRGPLWERVSARDSHTAVFQPDRAAAIAGRARSYRGIAVYLPDRGPLWERVSARDGLNAVHLPDRG
jgi:hypothetical protein